MTQIQPSSQTGERWLLRGATFTALTGVLMVAAALVPNALDPGVALLFGGELPGAGQPLGIPARLATAIAGAGLTGWAVTIGLIVRTLQDLNPQRVGFAFAMGTLAWFILDGVASAALGAYLNLFSNCLYLAILFTPAWTIYKSGPAKTQAPTATRAASSSAAPTA